jgi:hypothetical protein
MYGLAGVIFNVIRHLLSYYTKRTIIDFLFSRFAAWVYLAAGFASLPSASQRRRHAISMQFSACIFNYIVDYQCHLVQK